MKKNDLFTFTAPNGVEVQAVVVDKVASEYNWGNHTQTVRWMCYAQNRLFTCEEFYSIWDSEKCTGTRYDRIIVDYAVLPDYDELLARYNDIEVAQTETANGM